jgi:dephospho-CoA kinase
VLVIGLTGNIASGKSEVARIFADLGAHIIDADHLARDAVQPGTAALRAIVARWGEGILIPDGSLDRTALREIVFRDRAAREALNAIVHPEVRRRRNVALATARANGARVVVADIPLLFEAGLEGDVDQIVLVDAPDSVRLDRLVRLRGLAEEEARRMMAAQMPSSEKRGRAHHVIDNIGSLQDLREQTEAVWSALSRRTA